MKKLLGMLPFLEEEELQMLAEKIMASEDGIYKDIRMEMLLPFLEGDVVDQIFLEHIKDGKDYVNFLPFVSDKCLHEFAVKYVNDELEDEFVMDNFYPFMQDEDIRMIFRHALEK